MYNKNSVMQTKRYTPRPARITWGGRSILAPIMHPTALLTLTAALLLAPLARATPLSGTKNIPGDYATLDAAITGLNAAGVDTGGVTLNLLAGNPQTAPAGGYVIGGPGSQVLVTSSAANPVSIIGNGNTITAFSPQAAGLLTDAIFKLVGADWITLSGFTMQENSANTTTPAGSNTKTEWGVALLYASLTDGAQNNTISNNVISLTRTYRDAFGIYSNTRHSATDGLTTAEVTAAAGANSYNKVYANTISDVNYGIVFIGAGTTLAAIDTGNDIGGSSAAAGNTIINWGGFTAPSLYVSLATTLRLAIFDNQQINDNLSFNTITSDTLANNATTGGILKDYSVASPTSGSITTTINDNTVTVMNNPTTAGGGDIIGISNQGLTPLLATATMSMNSNTVQNCVLGGSTVLTAGLTGILNASLPGTMNMNGNSLLNNAITATTATSANNIAIQNTGAAGTLNMNYNTIRNIAGSGPVTGIVLGSLTANANIAQNTIHTLSSTGAAAVQAITSAAAVSSIFNNKIYDLLANNAGGTVNGLTVSAGTTVTIYNNLIGDLRAPVTSSGVAIRGINLTSTTANSSLNVYYNTVYLNATSSGTDFGTAGLYHTASTLATRAKLDLRNNLIVNTSTPNGTGKTVAYHRSTGAANMLANYASTANNNDFYAGVPGVGNLIYYDGTSSAQTLAAYKAGGFTAGTIAPRDSASLSENPTFLSTSGSSADFLHLNPAVATLLNRGGTAVSGITGDFDGGTRNATTPGIGADEFNPFPATDATYVRAPGLPLKIPIAAIASDPAHPPVSVQSLGASGQGATLSFNSTYIFYTPANNNNDSFTYTVQNSVSDTASATLTVNVVAAGGFARTITVSAGTATVKFFGIPGLQYDVQRTSSLTEPVTWTTLTPGSPLSPGADGSFTHTDASAPNGTAYYRCLQH